MVRADTDSCVTVPNSCARMLDVTVRSVIATSYHHTIGMPTTYLLSRSGVWRGWCNPLPLVHPSLLHPLIPYSHHWWLDFVQQEHRFLGRIIRNIYKLQFFVCQTQKRARLSSVFYDEAYWNVLRKKSAEKTIPILKTSSLYIALVGGTTSAHDLHVHWNANHLPVFSRSMNGETFTFIVCFRYSVTF